MGKDVYYEVNQGKAQFSTNSKKSRNANGPKVSKKARDTLDESYENVGEENIGAEYAAVNKNLKKKNRDPGLDRSNNWSNPGKVTEEGSMQASAQEGQYEDARPLDSVRGILGIGEDTEMMENPYYSA